MVEMETRYNSAGELIINVDEDTLVRVTRFSGVVLRQGMDGEVERVYLTLGELKEIVRILEEEAGK